MMRKFKLRWTVPALVTLALAAPALAGPGGGAYPARGPGAEPRGGPGAEHRRGPMLDPELMEELFDERAERIAELLDLTAEQRAAFDKARTDGFDAARPKMERMRLAGDELRALLDSGSTDAAQVGAKVIAMHRLRGELQAERKAVEAELSKLLTDEQRFAYRALREAHRDARARGPHETRRGPDHGPGLGPGAGL